MESTAGTDDETIMQVTSDLQLISLAYQKRQKHSLEAILRYLLGELSCTESLALLEASPDQPGLDLGSRLDLTSSDEDDDDDDQYAKVENQAPGLDSSNGMVAASNAQYNVPLRKACGAVWADDGRLVCFFPPKEEKPFAFLDSYSNKASTWDSKHLKNMFGGFGRLQNTFPTTQRTSFDLEAIETGDSDYESSRSSSDASSSNDVEMTSLTMMPSMAWREGTNRALSVDESQMSSGGNRQSKSATEGSRNFVSIHECAELLPAKRSLAEEYTLGSNAQCCLHNAGVARKHRELDLADIWDFVGLLLKDEVPLEMIQASSKPEQILVIARRTLSPLRSRDSAVDLSYDFYQDEHSPGFKGRIYWGSHPFGRRWFVNALYVLHLQIAQW